ncbi:hypothetical protein ACVJGD_008320 [Bradyrhizobium sp. USDA 10063]
MIKGPAFLEKGGVGLAAMAKAQGKDANEVGPSVAKSLGTLADPSLTMAVDHRAKLQVPNDNETPEPKAAREARIPAADNKLREAVADHVRQKPGDAEPAKKPMNDLGVKLERDNRRLLRDTQAKVTTTRTQHGMCGLWQRITHRMPLIRLKRGRLALHNRSHKRRRKTGSTGSHPSNSPAKPNASAKQKPRGRTQTRIGIKDGARSYSQPCDRSHRLGKLFRTRCRDKLQALSS